MKRIPIRRLSFLLEWLIAAGFLARLSQGRETYYGVGAALWILFGLLWAIGRLSRSQKLLTLNVGVLLIMLDLARGHIDWGGLWASTRRAEMVWLIPAFLAIFLSLLLRAFRWKTMLAHRYPHVRLGSLLGAMTLGLAANVIIPARVGEFLRAVYLGRRDKIPVSAAFASIVAERLMDLTILLSCLFLGISVVGFAEPKARWALAIGLPAAVGGFIFFAFWMRHQERASGWIRRRLPPNAAERINGLMQRFLSGVEFLRDRRVLAQVAVYSVLGWLLALANVECTLAAFDFGVPLPWVTPFLVLSFVAFSLVIPVTPAGIGVFQAAAALALAVATGRTVDEIGSETALAFGILLQLSQAVPILLMAIYFQFFGGVAVKELVEEGERTAEANASNTSAVE